MHPRMTIGAAVATLTSVCHAGTPFTMTSASYSITATAQGDYNESDSSTSIGPVGLSVGQRVPNEYDVDVALSSFNSDFIRTGVSAGSSTFGSSAIPCSTQSSATIVFSVPVDSFAVLRSEGSGGAGWQATTDPGATASYTAALIGPDGVLIQESAGETAEVFVRSANLPAGEYTLSVNSTTTSTADPMTTPTSRGLVAGGVRLDITAGFGPCNPADLAPPLNQIDLADIATFVTAFTAGDPAADLTGDGTNDLEDLTAFIDAFLAGCPY